LGGDRFLINGRVIYLNLEGVLGAFRNGATTIPIVVDEAAYHLDPALVSWAMHISSTSAPRMATPPPGRPRPRLREGPLRGEVLEQVCGGDQSQDVELYDGDFGVAKRFVADHQQRVGVLRWKGDLVRRFSNPGNVNGVRYCSGTLIADDLFLTAGHCLSPFPPDPSWEVPRIEGSNQPIPSSEIARNMKVEFNYQLDQLGNDRKPEPFPISELVEHVYSVDIDYAIVRLEGTPGQRFGVARVSARKVPPGDRICIIGHPQGALKRIGAGVASEYIGNRFYYRDIDTEGGTSGSGILGSPEGPLVGVHIAGGDCIDDLIGINRGVPMPLLLEVSPKLRGLCRDA
jgi:hypothetical protein